MRSSRRLVAFVSGLLMYGAAVMLAIVIFDLGIVEQLAASLGGRLNALIAMACAVAVLNFGLALLWAYSVVRVPVGSRRPLTGWCLSGVGLAWLAGTLGGVFFMVSRGDRALYVVDVLLSPKTAPFWGPANIVAVLAAVAVAGVWARRTAPPSRRRAAMA